MSTDWRALCEELADGLASTGEAASGTYKALLDRARAALAAEPVAEGPTPSDEELLKLARAELNNSPNWEEPEYDASNPFPYEAPGIAWLNFARAVLARFGHQPAPVPVAEFDCPACEDVPKQGNQPCAVCGRSAPPAAGEVAELALKELERTVVLLMPVTGHKKIKRFDTIRAALKRLQELENKADLSPTPMPLPAVEVK